MDDTTAQLLKIMGRAEEWKDLHQAVFDIGIALEDAHRDALQEYWEATMDPDVPAVKRDRFYDLLKLIAKFAVDRNIESAFLSHAFAFAPPEPLQGLAAAIGDERGISLTRVLAAFYSRADAILERAAEDAEGDE